MASNPIVFPQSLNTWKFWCQKVLPLVYDNSLSYYEVLCKVVEMCNDIINNNNEIIEILKEYEVTFEQLKEDMATVMEEMEKIKNGDYISNYIEALKDWIDRNLQEIVGRIVKYVIFGLSTDGHFVAYIPDSWDFMDFETIMDYSSPLYGHLIMRW